ncbi:hypothetical protein K7B10_39110 [Streptomyces flavotricini]|uniref:Uncharacterized protein n=1 Tax=Streptomyces flavotricini TaxID=66888 RepID=A0ABS8EHQ1_9ACTN|nr:hypothetical protein [Streptomyces flavotricini]
MVVGLLLVVALVDLESGDRIASVVGAAVGVLGLAVSVFALTRPASDPAVAGSRSVQAGGNIGRAVTGDNVRVTDPAPHVASGPAGQGPGANDTAVPGERGVSAGGSIGEAITGDGTRQQ